MRRSRRCSGGWSPRGAAVSTAPGPYLILGRDDRRNGYSRVTLRAGACMLDTEIIVPTVMFIALAMMILGVARVISDTIIRRRLIAAGNSGVIARMLAASAEDRVGGALKW